MMSYRQMSDELSRFVAGGVSHGSIYLWMRGTKPRPTLVQTLLDHGEGWALEFARELRAACPIAPTEQ